MPSNIYRVIIKSGEGLRIDGSANLNIEDRRADTMKVSTEELDEGFDCLVPRCLLFDCVIHETNIISAVNRAMSHVLFIARNISFVSNGYYGEVTPHVAYDATPGKVQRRFWQIWKQSPNDIPRISRLVPIEQLASLSVALDRSPYGKQLGMAIEHYVGALSYWRDGHELLALSRLFMSSEALSIAYKKHLMQDQNIDTREALANHLGIENTREIEGWIRREIVFKGEQECHQKAKKASDAFEHGYGEFSAMKAHSVAVCERTAAILRSAILEIIEIDDKEKHILLSDPYDVPQSIGGWTGACVGYLHGIGEELAAEHQQYPFMDFGFHVKSLRNDANATIMNIGLNEINGVLREGIEFKRETMSATDKIGYGFLPEE